jgi:hypothetical protein
MEDRNRTRNEGNDMNRDQDRGNMGEQKKPTQGSQQDQNREGQQGNQGNQQDRDRKQA